MSEAMGAALVRIRTTEGGIVGAGFLVGPCQVLTCAHVVAQALDLPEAHSDPPLTLVVLDFPLLAPRTRLAARVVFWRPVSDDGGGDLAGLELLGDPPEGAQMVRFAPAEDVWEHPFRAFGFPAGHDDGVWATGRLLGRQANNWLMLEDVKTAGFPVERGFSGSPVWDTQLQGVVGMVVTASLAGSKTAPSKTAFLLPFDVLAAKTATWYGLQPVTHQRIFLSAAPANQVFAERLRADLQARGIVVRDALNGPANTEVDAQQRLRQAMRDAQAVLLVVSSQTRASLVVKEHLRLANLYHRRLILVWIGDDERMQLQFAGWQDTALVDVRNTPYASALTQIETALSQRRSLTELFEPARGEGEPEPRNPYKGLHPFTADDVGDFFGRQRLVSELVDDVASLLPATSFGTGNERCLSIIGPSGSGKSSVVMAGLLPRLQQGALSGSERWVYLQSMLPGKHPIEALIQTLKRHLPDISLKTLREDLEDDTTQGLHLLAAQLVKERGSRVVLLVDQFEELFTQTETEDERQRFIDLLLTAVTMPGGPLLVLLTLRADFYDRPMQYPPLSRLMQAHQRQVLPMDVEDLRATIEQPAALPDVQLSFEGNLVGDLLFEVRGQIGALPLLQFALYQLFDKRDRRCLTLQAYHEMGGVKGALSQHADEAYQALPSDEHRQMAREVFLRLVSPGATEQDTTRRRATHTEFEYADPAQTQETLERFIRARLLTTSQINGITTIEVSHEALIREWKRLAEWLHEARGDILIQQDLSKDTTEWEQHGKPRDRLYHGSQLKEVQAWAKRNRPSEREAAFLRASAVRRIQSLVSLIVVVCLLIASMGIAGGYLFLRTFVTTLSDNNELGSLRWCIDNAPPGSTIKFAPWLSGTIELTGSLIVGNDETLTIEGLGANRVAISGGNMNANIHVSKGATLNLSGLSFKDSETVGDAFLFNEGTLMMENSIISNNQTQGLKNSTSVSRYISSSYGGAIENEGTFTMIQSTVANNSSSGELLGLGAGGGIYNEGMLTVIASIFSNNSSSGGLLGSDGGGIYNASTGRVKVISSTFSNNSASSSNDGNSQGGGISNEGELSVQNSRFYNNVARGDAWGYGGGIKNAKTGTLTVTNSTFSGNLAKSNKQNGVGGGIDNEGRLTVAHSTFSNNTVSSSNSWSLGGGIANHPASTGIVTDSIFSGNLAKGAQGGKGGGIVNDDGKLSVTHSTFSNNTVNSGISLGGGIYNHGQGTLTVTSSTFSNNSVSGQQTSGGGGIENEGGKLTVIASTFWNNSASTNGEASLGGGIWAFGLKGASTIIRFCTIYKNTSSAGGGIWADPTGNSNLIISSNIIAANSADDGPDISGALTSGGYNLLTNVTGASGLGSTDQQVTLDDLRIEQTLGNNGGPTQTLKLLPGSVAIDAVPRQACSITITDAVSGQPITITTDQRGDPRPGRSKSACDAGAYESSS